MFQLGQCLHGIVVGTSAKPDLNRPNQFTPGGYRIAGLEFLEPHQGFFIHVKGGNGEALVVGGAVHVKELLGVAAPCLWVIPIETGKFQPDRFRFEAIPRAGASWK